MSDNFQSAGGSASSEGDRTGQLDLGHVTSRRNLLKGAVAIGITTAELPTFLRKSTTHTRPLVSTARRGGPGLWNGQPVTEPIGLSFEGTPKRGGHITWAWIYEPVPQMDPQLPTTGDTGDLQALYSLYDRLTNIIPGTLTNGPGLAESWEIAKGGLEYTFHLRHAEFSNGDTITANDVKFSLERFANPAINSQYAWLNAIDTVQALNARTVRVTLQYVQAMFLDVVGHATTGIVPRPRG